MKPTEQQIEDFNAWLDETNYFYYDSHETIINLRTKKLYAFQEIFEMFLNETHEVIEETVYVTPSCKFKITSLKNTVNNFLSDYVPPGDEEYENREDEAQRMAEWAEREAENQLDNHHK